jgi:hypothetical protein
MALSFTTFPITLKRFGLMIDCEMHNKHSETISNVLKLYGIHPFNKILFGLPEGSWQFTEVIKKFITETIFENGTINNINIIYSTYEDNNISLSSRVKFENIHNMYNYSPVVNVRSYKKTSYEQIYKLLEAYPPTFFTTIHIKYSKPLSKEEKHYLKKLETMTINGDVVIDDRQICEKMKSSCIFIYSIKSF